MGRLNKAMQDEYKFSCTPFINCTMCGHAIEVSSGIVVARKEMRNHFLEKHKDGSYG